LPALTEAQAFLKACKTLGPCAERPEPDYNNE